MTLLNKVGLIATLLIVSFNCVSEEKEPLRFSTIEVASGLYMLEGVGGFAGGNIAVSVGEDGVVMIDDAMPETLGIMKVAIKSITDKPVDFLINTHFHWDHAGNNDVMKKMGTRIFAHENARKRLKVELGKTEKDALPVFTFSNQMNFHLNGNDTQLFHVANAHTDGDIIIYFKNLNVMHAGDVFVNGMFPFIALENGGTITGLIAAQREMLSLADAKTKIIPGHGALANIEDLKASVAMLEESKKLISELIALNKSEEEIVTLNPLLQYQTLSREFITTEKMTRQVYRSLVSEGE
ncbi:MAG: MBL fold metallo-hydrolase [Methylophilaceae bacterium]